MRRLHARRGAALRSARSSLLAKGTEQFHIVHDPDFLAGAELQHIWFVEMPIYRANHIGCSNERRTDHRVIVRACEYDPWAFRRNDDLAQRLQVLDVLLDLGVSEPVNEPDTRVSQNPLDLADEKRG